MASWTTPITNWNSSNYYNFGDLDRVEENTEYLKDEWENIGYSIGTTTFKYPRTNSTIDFYDDLNRVENNILALGTGSFIPSPWITPVTDWVTGNSFDFNDANRLEKNLNSLYDSLNNVKDSLMPTGHPLLICGKGNTRF